MVNEMAGHNGMIAGHLSNKPFRNVSQERDWNVAH
jgi:hypothetical protein